MAQRRWRPPPMGDKPAEPESAGQKVKVDEQVVRKMLKVNPDMRKGRTTFQVKKALETGEAVGGSQPSAKPRPAAGRTTTPSAAPAGAGKELRETIDFFVRGKAQNLASELDAIAARRKALDEEEAALKQELAGQVASFVGLLDSGEVAAHGRTALSKHVGFLDQLGLSVAALLERATRRK